MAITEKKLRELIDFKPDAEKISTLSSDGRNLLTRIPKEIREVAGMKKGDKLRWTAKDGHIKIEIIENAKKEN
jgi:bifunctional DNA-binding transcriptional regulator/antitoxin component of YhaV-PrlF toxin-antitoxin module